MKAAGVQPFIPQMEPWFDERESSALAAYMATGGWLTEFKETEKFENAIAAFTGARYCVVVNNGTISLTLALVALGIGAGDEVIVPNYTMIASPNSARMIGASPVFVDVDPDTLCADLAAVKRAITPRTKAVMLVTANGRYPACGIQPFSDLCAERGLFLIEDAAQSLGSRQPDGRHHGTCGVVGSFSFSVPKIITTGQGGALVTDDPEMMQRLRLLKDFGRRAGGTDIHDTLGYNFKFTDLQAVIGNVQMEKLAWRVERKRAMMRRYQQQLALVPQLRFFNTDLENTTPWFIDVLCEERDALASYLKSNGIGSRAMYPPINRQMAYQTHGSYPVSEDVGRRGLWLPSQSQLTDEQIDRICETIRRFYSSR